MSPKVALQYLLPHRLLSAGMRALMHWRWSPWTTAWLTSGNVFSEPSRFCGATFLPPAVTMMSVLRSVMRT